MQNHVEKAKSTKEKEGEKKMKEKMLKKVLVNNSIFTDLRHLLTE